MASLVKLGGVGVSNQRGDAGVQRGGGGKQTGRTS